MATDTPPSVAGAGAGNPNPPPSSGIGPALRRAWLGYQRRLDAAMADAGFGERVLPEGRVLRLCTGPAGSTISAIGRELGITRQGASKVVRHLVERGYVSVADSPTSKRERAVTVTSRGVDYLRAHREAARTIEGEVRTALGETAFSALLALVATLDDGEPERLRAYLQRSTLPRSTPPRSTPPRSTPATSTGRDSTRQHSAGNGPTVT